LAETWEDLVLLPGSKSRRALVAACGMSVVLAAALASVASADLYWTSGNPEAIGRAELDGSGAESSFIDLEEAETEPNGAAPPECEGVRVLLRDSWLRGRFRREKAVPIAGCIRGFR
jgi:hypothetical protein